MDDVRSALVAAKANGEILRVRYNGGSQPGAVRELIPIAVEADRARCRCYTSGAVKVFVIGKMELLSRGPSAPEGTGWSHEAAPRAPDTRPDIPLAELHDLLSDDLAAAGWHVALETTEFGECIALYAVTKKGVIRKHPKVCLIYEHTAADHMPRADGSFAYQNHRPRRRPWSVRTASEGSLGTWARCWPALEKFWEPAGIRPRLDL